MSGRKELQLHIIAHMRDVTEEDVKHLEPRASGSLYRSLVAWAKIQPGAAYLVEAETGRELTYAHTLASVNSVRQLLGDTPRRIVLALPGGVVNAVIWLSALSRGLMFVPPSPRAPEEGKVRLAQKHRPDVLFCLPKQKAQGFAFPP